MAKKKRGDREAGKRRAVFFEQQRRLKRRRTIVGSLGFLPLGASLFGCTGGLLDILCLVPREVWMLLWAALFGSFLGLTIRLILERRRFDRATPDRPAA